MGQETGKPLSKEDSVQELLGILVQFQEKGLFDSLMETVNHVQDMEVEPEKPEQTEINDRRMQTGPVQKPHFTYQDEVQDFMGQAVAENKSYGSVRMPLMRSWHTGREKAQRSRQGRQEGQPCSSRLSRQQGRQGKRRRSIEKLRQSITKRKYGCRAERRERPGKKQKGDEGSRDILETDKNRIRETT